MTKTILILLVFLVGCEKQKREIDWPLSPPDWVGVCQWKLEARGTELSAELERLSVVDTDKFFYQDGKKVPIKRMLPPTKRTKQIQKEMDALFFGREDFMEKCRDEIYKNKGKTK